MTFPLSAENVKRVWKAVAGEEGSIAYGVDAVGYLDPDADNEEKLAQLLQKQPNTELQLLVMCTRNPGHGPGVCTLSFNGEKNYSYRH